MPDLASFLRALVVVLVCCGVAYLLGVLLRGFVERPKSRWRIVSLDPAARARPARPTWDETYLELAFVVAKRSPCCKRQVGAVLVSDDKCILGAGYNGPPRGAPHRTELTCIRRDIPSGTQADVVCCAHAETNAIAQAARHGVAVKGATLYVTTSPCAGCARTVINAGVVRVVAATPYADPVAAVVFAESNVVVDLYTLADGSQ